MEIKEIKPIIQSGKLYILGPILLSMFEMRALSRTKVPLIVVNNEANLHHWLLIRVAIKVLTTFDSIHKKSIVIVLLVQLMDGTFSWYFSFPTPNSVLWYSNSKPPHNNTILTLDSPDLKFEPPRPKSNGSRIRAGLVLEFLKHVWSPSALGLALNSQI